MALRPEQLTRGFLLSCAHTTGAGISLGWDVCGGLHGGGGCLSCNQTGSAKRCQRLPGLGPAPWPWEEWGSHCERRRGDQPAPTSVRGHGAVLGCPGAEPHPGRDGPSPGETSSSDAAQGGHFLHMFLNQTWLLKSVEEEIPLQPGEPSCPHSSLGPSKELRNPIPLICFENTNLKL